MRARFKIAVGLLRTAPVDAIAMVAAVQKFIEFVQRERRWQWIVRLMSFERRMEPHENCEVTWKRVLADPHEAASPPGAAEQRPPSFDRNETDRIDAMREQRQIDLRLRRRRIEIPIHRLE